MKVMRGGGRWGGREEARGAREAEQENEQTEDGAVGALRADLA